MSRTRRRRLAIKMLGAGVLMGAPLAALAQSARTLRIAILDDASEKTRGHFYRAMRVRLQELGYAEGKNLVVEIRYGRGVTNRLPALATDLVALKPDVLVTVTTPATRAAIKASSSIPIVFIALADPVASGLVASLARPGGNATGLSAFATEIGAKWLELMRDIAPGAKRLAYLTDMRNSGAVLGLGRVQEQARQMGVTVEGFGGPLLEELERSFEIIARERFTGLIVGQITSLLDHRDRIVQFAARQEIPAIYARPEYAEAGGLLAYGSDLSGQYRRAAEYIHRIAQGGKPADMPVERPSSVRMVVNLKTARTLGIAIPATLRYRADELID